MNGCDICIFMSAGFSYFIYALLSVMVLVGIAMMSKVKTAVSGNQLAALALFAGVVYTLRVNGIVGVWQLYPPIILGAIVGGMWASRVKMIQMPQLVALLNGIGGGASALVGLLSLRGDVFSSFTAFLAVLIGMVTLVGSLVAAGKLHRVLPQRAQVWTNHSMITSLSILIAFVFCIVGVLNRNSDWPLLWMAFGTVLFSAIFGLYFAIRVGGADMPITISLLNSLSGVAGAIAGMAIGNILLVAVGGIVGASGLLLTQIMCRAMNRSLTAILFAQSPKAQVVKTPSAPAKGTVTPQTASKPETTPRKETPIEHAGTVLSTAKDVIIVPGYGMALAQAQHLVKQLADKLSVNGARVRYAIHPVAGRMPGHMNVLLAEANVDYDELFEMEQINGDFNATDVVVVVGANDVLNPAARDAEGTPIYGMPVLNVDQAPEVIICNYDLNPGYAGVSNPLYTREQGVSLLIGDAKETLSGLMKAMDAQSLAAGEKSLAENSSSREKTPAMALKSAKDVIIVPGYGMALAQAQHLVKQLADKLSANGARVRYAIHPVAGRMPGHMNVLLAEANVDYDELFEMEQINGDFNATDVVVVVGANDVLNPAARDAEGTPIYGMPVLNVDQAPEVIICNYDLNPGYAGVPNPLYTREQGVSLLIGDAKETLSGLMKAMDAAEADTTGCSSGKVSSSTSHSPVKILQSAKDVIIVPGYGMALAQAQHLVKQLADKLSANGARVRYAIHPVAGRMPGHMNVLLAEANVDYDELFEMEQINGDFNATDVVVVVGANDVLNPAARDAEGTPIYGMPVLNVDQAPEVIICNYDLNPGYAGVPNPLYTREQGVSLLIGDAKETLSGLLKW